PLAIPHAKLSCRSAHAVERLNIGYPQLFTGAERSPCESSAKATVNNCAGARAPQQDSDGFRHAFALSASSVFPHGGPGLRTTSRLTTLSSIDRPAGRGLTL